MDLVSLREAVKRYGFDDSDPLDSWINAAYHDVESVTEWPFLEGFVPSTNTVAGSNVLSLPSDLGKIISIRETTTMVKLDFVSRRAFERDVADPTTPGKPTEYTLIGLETIQLYPVPDAIYSMSLYYAKELVDLTDAAPALGIPSRLHYAVALSAVRYGLMAESEEERAHEAESLYNDALGRAMSYYGLRELDEPHTVVDTAGYSEDGS